MPKVSMAAKVTAIIAGVLLPLAVLAIVGAKLTALGSHPADANIGGGILALLGSVLAVVGLAALAVHVVIRLVHRWR